MTLYIDRLTIRLPSGFEHRASAIAAQVAEHLAAQGINPGRSMDGVRINAASVNPVHSDTAVARQISEQISLSIKGGQ